MRAFVESEMAKPEASPVDPMHPTDDPSWTGNKLAIVAGTTLACALCLIYFLATTIGEKF